MNCLLVNTLKTNSKQLGVSLKRELDIDLSPLSFCPSAYLPTNPGSSLSKSTAFGRGNFYLQNPSSLLPVITLEPSPNDEAILDIAAAPGGKTFHIAMLMKNMGEIVANDMSLTRMNRMKEMLEKYEVTNTKFVSRPGQMLWQKYPEKFAKVLVDAPCTMQGTDTPSKDSPKKMAHIQTSLLRAAIACTKPGGTIVYSTCTNTLEENEDVISQILEREHGAIELLPVDLPEDIPRDITRSKDSKGHDYNFDTKLVFRVPRGDIFEGFFIAKIKKKNVSTKKKHI